MLRRFSKIIVAVSVMLFVFLPFLSACGPDETIIIDETKTQLYAGVYDGGFGREWLFELGSRFEEKYADVSFEPGKKGVQVVYDGNKDQFVGESVLTAAKFNRQDLYFTQDTNYYDGISRGVFADITDIVTEKFDTVDFGDGSKVYSIEDKIPGDVKDYLNKDGKYYALQYASPVASLIYDVDLFCKKKLYFLEDGTINGSIDNPNQQLLNGNGLPATWPQFKQLMDEMVKRNLLPFTWCGQYAYQRNSFYLQLWANYEGYNDYVVNATFNGELKDGRVIDESNAYLLAESHGRRAALQACYDIVSNDKYFSSDAFKTTQSHTYAQEEFIYSTVTSKPIAMFIEGMFWETEAKGVFADMAMDGDEYSQNVRRFAAMPIPRFVGMPGIADQTSDENVFVAYGNSICFVNAHSSKLELAKSFLQFFHSNESMSKFNSMTGTIMNLKYKMSESDYNAMTYFQKSVYDQFDNGGRKVVTPYTGQSGHQSTFRVKNNAYFTYWTGNPILINQMAYAEPLKSFYVNKFSVDQWWDSFSQLYNKDTWPLNT